MSVQSALVLIGMIAAVGIVVDSLEQIAQRETLSESGVFAFSVLRTGWRPFVDGPMARPLSWLMAYPRVLAVLALQMGGALLLLVLPLADDGLRQVLGIAGFALVVVSRMLIYARNQMGLDGSDQMFLVVSTAGLIGWLGARTGAVDVAVIYIACQLILAYVVAGVAKASSPIWRSGRALGALLDTVGLGRPQLAALLRRHATVSVAACWFVIVFECLGPALVLGGVRGAWCFIAVSGAFHLAIAFVMGLNSFVWAFGATYPAVLFLAELAG